MYRIKSQLCEVFDATRINWKKAACWKSLTPGSGRTRISNSLEYGEMINGKIAEKFCAFYKSRIRL